MDTQNKQPCINQVELNKYDISILSNTCNAHLLSFKILVPSSPLERKRLKAGESSEQSRNQGNLQKGCNASHVKQLLTWLQQGNIVVLVRDTGTPVISDPDMEPLCLAS
ncbi:hypothetical protein AAC387_Pa06g1205 [Persea americana]